MNNLVIPPSPNWYESKILACSVDNTVIYGTRNEIVVINPKPYDQPADVKVIPHAHYERIVSIDVNPNWGDFDKLAVSAADDKIVKLWDVEKYECRGSHNTHTTNSEKLIGACFAGSDRVVSVSENGFVAIWRTGNNEVSSLKNLFNFKVHVTCISSCPHVAWLTAFGLKCGLVVITDIRKSGKVLYKLRGHDKNVVSLSWCPTPFNIFPKNFPNKNRKILNTTKETDGDSAKETSGSNLSDRESVGQEKDAPGRGNRQDDVKKNLETKTQATVKNPNPEVKPQVAKKSNPWINLKHADDDEVQSDPFLQENTSRIMVSPVSDDFLSECEALKRKIADTTNGSTGAVKPRISSPSPKSRKELIFSRPVKVDALTMLDGNGLSGSNPLSLEDANTSSEKLSTSSTSGESHDLSVCKPENPVDLVSDSELDNEIQEIFQPTKEYLLASSARGGPIYIWRAGTDGRVQKELPVSGKSGRRNYRSGDKSWVTICWIMPEVLLSSSPTGELLQWDLLKTSGNSNIPQKKLVHHDHGTNLFSIAAPIHIFQVWEEENWRDRKDLHAWTAGQDRFLLNTSLLADRKTLASYPTIGGHIYCLTSSPLDPCRIAVGIGDNTAKVWDLSRPNLQCIVMSNLWQKIQSKVLALAWHPTKEMSLAYSTFEGRVGIINTNNTSKMPTLLSQYFRSSVYNVEWGPLNGNRENLGLYACGEGKLVLYNTDRPLEDPVLIETPSKEYVFQMSWKPDFSILAVGTKIGSIAFYDVNLKHLSTLYTEHKTIQILSWHPEATAVDTEKSPYAFWLAAGAGDGVALVYDLSGLHCKEAESSHCDRIVAILSGHAKAVKNLAWSSYEGGKLVSCGDDGIAQVWDVKTKTVISTFVGHNVEPIWSVMWSPLEKNYIISGGKDMSIRVWNISEHPPLSSEDLAEIFKVRSKLRVEAKKSSRKQDDSDEEEPKKVKRDIMLHQTAKIQNTTSATLLEDCKRLLRVGETGSAQDEERLPESESKEDKPSVTRDGSGVDVLNVFGDKNDMISLVEAEQRTHMEKGKFICNQHLSLWKGDLAETIKEAIKTGSVTPWLVSMAPMVSPKLWQEACEVYARKSMDNVKSDPIETASYLLACHKVEDAVQVLCGATLFRDALAIAKCRLSSSDPIVNDIIQKWATFSIVNGSYEVAAQCFISLQQYEEAAKALFRRTDPKVLEFAVELAQKSGNKDLLDAITVRYESFKLTDVQPAKEEPMQTKLDAHLQKELLSVEKAGGDSASARDVRDTINEELCILTEKQLQINKSSDEEQNPRLNEAEDSLFVIDPVAVSKCDEKTNISPEGGVATEVKATVDAETKPKEKKTEIKESDVIVPHEPSEK